MEHKGKQRRTAIVAPSPEARRMAEKLVASLPIAFLAERAEVESLWRERRADAIVFVAAMGICVRTIAPLLRDKHEDPAIVCIDALGRNAVAVAGGHEAGANSLAKEIADITGANAVVTTLSDCKGTWALDLLARQWGWTARTTTAMNDLIALFTAGKLTALLTETTDRGTEWMAAHMPYNVRTVESADEIKEGNYEMAIIVSPLAHEDITVPTLQLIPRSITIGVGMGRLAGPPERVCQEIEEALDEGGVRKEAVARIATIDRKRDEPALHLLAERLHAETVFFSAEELDRVETPTPSQTAKRIVGTRSVCEAAALLASGGRLLIAKRKGKDWTLAAAWRGGTRGRVDFVGAGPGDPELITVRGRTIIGDADLVLYAGSLVPRDIADYAKPNADIRSSAGMTLQQQTSLMADYCKRGLRVARLHTGDPCLYGAIAEQMARLDEMGIDYDITPGVSAFQAAAARLKSQLTIPGGTQTIILTRGEGRTAMPKTEQLRLLAKARSSMCIYLSADIVEDVERQLLEEYGAETPVAVCYRLTWKQERVWRTTLSHLAETVRGNNIDRDTLIVVGEAIDNRKGESRLYAKDFSHLYRKGEE